MPVGDGYARVYFAVLEDPKFEQVYADDHHLATWLRLLIAAEIAWPASVPIPSDARPTSVQVLNKVGLIDLAPHRHYRVHGLDAERERRTAPQRHAAQVRWKNAADAAHMRGNARPSPSPSPSPSSSKELSAAHAPHVENPDFDRRVEATQRMLAEVRGEK